MFDAMRLLDYGRAQNLDFNITTFSTLLTQFFIIYEFKAYSG